MQKSEVLSLQKGDPIKEFQAQQITQIGKMELDLISKTIRIF